MLNKKRKGFTIVELVIVIAVIAVLAAVLIPTFAGIIDKANESADKQAVRQMNIALAAESIENKPDDVGDVIDILAAAGFNSTDKLVPVSAKHGFYWSAKANMITLIRDEGEGFPELIFPTEEAALNTAFDAAKTDWTAATTGANVVFFDLETAGEEAGLPTGSGNGGGNDPVEPTPTPEGTPLVIDDLIYSDEDGAYLLPAGTYYLADRTDINVPVVTEGEVKINLNGKTLKLMDSTGDGADHFNVLSVNGKLTITGSGNVDIAKPTSDEANDEYYGFCVNGALNLDGVNITGNRDWNIGNYGTTNLNNVKYTVKCGYGLATAGADTTDSETGETVASVTISDSTFIATGDVTPIAGYYDGSMEISETVFSKDPSSVTYSGAVINWGSRGDLTLTDVTVESEASETNVSSPSAKLTVNGGDFGGALIGMPLVITADKDDEFAGEITFSGSGNSISGGTFNGKLTFGQYSETTITDGTFTDGLYCDGANVTIEDGTFSEDGDLKISGKSTVTINGGTFSGDLEISGKSTVRINGGTFHSQLKCVARTSGTKITITKKNENEPVFSDGTNSVSYEAITNEILAEGSDCVISGTADSGWIISAPVDVDTVSLSQQNLALFGVGDTATLTAVVKPDNATYKTVTWTSSDINVATVDQNGTVTAIAVGKATITASADGKSVDCLVQVNPAK